MTLFFSTKEAIEIISRMDLRVAVPPKYQSPMSYDGSITTTTKIQYIHVPSVIAMLLHEIDRAQLEVATIRRATAVLMGIKKEYGE